MHRILTLLLALLLTPMAWAVNVGEMTLEQRYPTEMFEEFVATFRAPDDGLYRVMSTMSDFPMPYHDAAHTELYDDFIVSYYDGSQGYILTLSAGETVYLYRDFCMNPSCFVWVESCATTLEYTAQPELGTRLLPTGAGQFVLTFPQPVSCDGGTLSCGGQSVALPPSGGGRSLIYDVKQTVMEWIRSGIAPGTDITVALDNVHAIADASLKAGDSRGHLEVHYVLPNAPGEFVRDNFARRTFQSYWFEDDAYGIFRMTFTRPVNVENPGFLNVIYGNADVGDIGSVQVPGKAEGKDIVFDLRGQFFRPSDIIGPGSTSVYDSIRVSPSAIRDDRGDYMFSPGAGTLGSWDYGMPYQWFNRDCSTPWELTDTDENEVDRLYPGDEIMVYLYNFDYAQFSAFRFTFEDGTSVAVPLSAARVEWYETALTVDALYTLSVPTVAAPHARVTVTLDGLRYLNGTAPDWSQTYIWKDGTELPPAVEPLDYSVQPEAGTVLRIADGPRVVFTFPQPMASDGGTITCGDQVAELPAVSGQSTITCDLHDLVIDWVRRGIPSGSDITLHIYNVRAQDDEHLKAGDDEGHIEVHYLLPEAPGEYVADNFAARTFKSYWLADDAEGIFRMTFTRPVSVENPGVLRITYGEGDTAGSMTLPGAAEGKDLVFDLRGRFFRPADFLFEGCDALYDAIRLSASDIRDDRGELMYAPESAVPGTWTYTLPYRWYHSALTQPTLTDGDAQPLSVLQPGDRLRFSISDYDCYRFDGILFTFDDGTRLLVSLADLDIEITATPGHQQAEVSLTVPTVEGDPRSVTVTFAGLLCLADGSAPDWQYVLDWHNPQSGISALTAPSAAQRAYDLLGRPLRRGDRPALRIESGRTVLTR